MKVKYEKKRFIGILMLIAVFSSCGSKKDLVYFQNQEDAFTNPYIIDSSYYDLRIRPSDNLLITVSSVNPLAVEPYNTISMQGSGSMYTQGLEYRGYLVDNYGFIKFPGLGKIQVGGLSKSEAEQLIQKEISKTVSDCSVNIRFLNYRVSVLGEVNKPGIYTISSERVSIVEAIALAGDLTIYGQRHNIRVFRVENDGQKTAYTIDLTQPEVFYSPVYYLQQNDVVVINPNNTRIRSSTNIMPILSVVITSLSFIMTTMTFIWNQKK
ncbi:MAG: polysaccharide biosynthesis/export family protein [Dysgonamonadaceae bacterium]|jgi:polysaccharide export outer membrane protein|nr:polysaccharide biosynthesis/export family protein [Dysgonamonadaceae bacterium]